MWATSKRLEAFFADAERRLEGLYEDERVRTTERLRHARNLIGSMDALERFQSRKAPEERYLQSVNGQDPYQYHSPI